MKSRARLVKYLRDLCPDVRARLARLKEKGQTDRSRSDFLWYFLVTSFSTMGNSRGFDGLMADPDNLQRLSYDSLLAVAAGRRKATIEDVLRRAKVRMPARKAGWLARNMTAIGKMGGLIKANADAPG